MYYNFKFKYRIKYPAGWLAINSKHKKKDQEVFKKKIAGYNPFLNYNSVDVIFCNPEANAPTYDFIAINSINQLIHLKKINKPLIESLLLLDLTTKYKNIKILSTQLTTFAAINCYQIDLSFYYQNQQYYSTNLILQGNIFSTQLVSTIYPQERKKIIFKELEYILKSYKRI